MNDMKAARIRITVMILFVAVIVAAIGTGTAVYFSEQNIKTTIEKNMATVAQIADRFLSDEIAMLEGSAEGISKAVALTAAGTDDMREALDAELAAQDRFIAAAVFSEGRILCSSGNGQVEMQTDLTSRDEYKAALAGTAIVSTTIEEGDDLNFYVFAPYDGPGGKGVLAAALPALYFTNALEDITIWDTGHIFMVDKDGYIIANMRTEWVMNRANNIIAAKTDKSLKPIATMVFRITNGESGVGYYEISGAERLCAYGPVTGSDGFGIGVVSPTSETPLGSNRDRLILTGLIALAAGLAAAFVISAYIGRQFKRLDPPPGSIREWGRTQES
jgi:methyl-accepting chemotaxis protein